MNSKYRKGVFVIAYATEKEKLLYLLLKRKLHWKGWEFPKGGMEKREAAISAAKRELKEETGKKPIAIRKFNIRGKYKYEKEYNNREGLSGQTYEVLFAAKVEKGGKIRIDKEEHSSYAWLEFKEAMKNLTWPNQRKCLRIVNEWLSHKGKTK